MTMRSIYANPMTVIAAPHINEPKHPVALTEHEAESLDDRHKSENYADRAACARPKPSDKSCVNEIVNVRDQHADDCRDRKGRDQPRDGRRGHLFVLCHLRFVCHFQLYFASLSWERRNSVRVIAEFTWRRASLIFCWTIKSTMNPSRKKSANAINSPTSTLI